MHQGIYLDILPCDAAAKSRLGRVVQFCAAKVVISKALDQRGYETDNLAKRMWLAVCRKLPMEPFYKRVIAGTSEETVHTFLAASSAYRKNVWPRRYFTETVRQRFGGAQYPISVHYDAMLRQLYGDYQKLPSMRKRAEKQHAWLVDAEQSYENYVNYRDGMDYKIRTRSRR